MKEVVKESKKNRKKSKTIKDHSNKPDKEHQDPKIKGIFEEEINKVSLEQTNENVDKNNQKRKKSKVVHDYPEKPDKRYQELRAEARNDKLGGNKEY